MRKFTNFVNILIIDTLHWVSTYVAGTPLPGPRTRVGHEHELDTYMTHVGHETYVSGFTFFTGYTQDKVHDFWTRSRHID